MSSNEGQQQARDEEQPQTDSANNELGPTEKLRERGTSGAELSVPGVQDPNNEEIKDEQNPNTE
ncbi:MAG TPA: hypothetical protein VEW46_01620 [Pyrinomonadaceae bacterium]|nr:hypothetical protein [Pyrinomonadaceae bacterium]